MLCRDDCYLLDRLDSIPSVLECSPEICRWIAIAIERRNISRNHPIDRMNNIETGITTGVINALACRRFYGGGVDSTQRVGDHFKTLGANNGNGGAHLKDGSIIV